LEYTAGFGFDFLTPGWSFSQILGLDFALPLCWRERGMVLGQTSSLRDRDFGF
jgi:hypothetical protein